MVRNLIRSVNIIFILIVVQICVVNCGRYGGGGGSRSSGGWSTGRGSSGSRHGSGSSNHGWTKPDTRTHSNTGSNNYGWKKPEPSHTSTGTNAGSNNYGWKKPEQSHPNTGTGTNTGSNNYGWKKPEQSHPNTGTGTNTGSNNYGWKKPETAHPNTGTQGNSNPASTNYGWKKPESQSPGTHTNSKQPETAHNVKTPNTNTAHTQNSAQNRAPPPYTPYDVNKPPSSNIGPGGYPVQAGHPSHTYNTGYSQTGYHHPPPAYPGSHTSSYGYTPHYYPPQNSFGYPGQGIYGGMHGPTYGGMNIYGGPTGHYSYPTSGAWGYPNYGSGGFGSSSGTYDVLKGVAIGYLANSLIHRITNPWGYSGSNYGHGYGHYGKTVIINNNVETVPKVSDPTQTPKPQHHTPPDTAPEDKWVHCVAYDPKTKETLINPNCSCTVTTHTDPETNITTSSHNCTSSSNADREREDLLTPAPKGNAMKYKDVETYATGVGEYQTTTESVEQKAIRKRNEFYKKLEKIVNMGKFST